VIGRFEKDELVYVKGHNIKVINNLIVKGFRRDCYTLMRTAKSGGTYYVSYWKGFVNKQNKNINLNHGSGKMVKEEIITREKVDFRLKPIEERLNDVASKQYLQKERIEKLEGLDLSKYLKREDEVDEIIDKRIANLLEISSKLKGLNFHKREAIIEYLAKKAGVSKGNLNKVIETFEKYLDKIL